jgi:hypothetical protein
MRAVILRTLAVIGAGALVLAGVLFLASTVDGRPPTVLDVRLTQPVGEEEALALVTTSVEIAFNEEVDAASAEAAVTLTPDVETAASWSGSTLTITPVEPLSLASEYVVTVAAGVRDVAGNVMSEPPDPFAFLTVGAPALADSSPADGAEAVPLDAVVTLAFTTLMDTVSVEEHLEITPSIAHELRWSGRVLEIIPDEPMEPDTEYRVALEAGATDTAGVQLDTDVDVRFRTVASALEIETLVPADGSDGIAIVSPIAIVFSDPIDPDTVEDAMLTIAPGVAGTIEVMPLSGDPESESGEGRALVFTPSEPLPPNTTFEIDLAAGIGTTDGLTLGTPTRWAFTTGVAARELSNQITFLSSRGGVTNVWAMNPDGSGQRQLSVELEPIVDYAVAPDGSSLVVADGRRLVHIAADGSGRRVLTPPDALAFDPAYSPDSRRVAFGRADALTGAPLGLWQWSVGGGDPERIALPDEGAASPQPTSGPGAALRAPRFSPDGEALAFVDARGSVGVLGLLDARVTFAPFLAAATPTWLPDSSAVMLAGARTEETVERTFEAPVAPLAPGPADATFRLPRGAVSVSPSPFGTGSYVVAISAAGEIAYVDDDGALWLTDLPNTAPGGPALSGVPVRAAAFGPGSAAIVIEVAVADGSRLERFEPESGVRTRLSDDGTRPYWVP